MPLLVAAEPLDGCVVSGSSDKTLRVWDVEAQQTVATVYGDGGFASVTCVDQYLIVAGDQAGNVWFRLGSTRHGMVGSPRGLGPRSPKVSATHAQDPRRSRDLAARSAYLRQSSADRLSRSRPIEFRSAELLARSRHLEFRSEELLPEVN